MAATEVKAQLSYGGTFYTPKQIVFIGDSLDVENTTNYGSTSGGWITCGGFSNNIASNYTAGVGYYWNNNPYSTKSWCAVVTNLWQARGYTVSLDNSFCVPGCSVANFTGYESWQSEYKNQDWTGNGAAYNSAGTNGNVLFQEGATNYLVFGSTNDYSATVNGVTYTNDQTGHAAYYIYAPGFSYQYLNGVNFYLTGKANALIGTIVYTKYYAGQEYCNVQGHGPGGPIGDYFPPYLRHDGNDFINVISPLNYLVTNVAPKVTGVSKAAVVALGQNDYTTGLINGKTNLLQFQYQGLMKMCSVLKSNGFAPVVLCTVPFSPSFGISKWSTNTAQLNNMILATPTGGTNSVDIIYDWRASNSVYELNSSYYVDNVHPTAQLAMIEATNFANFFNAPARPKIQTNGLGFGVSSNKFGFNITGITNGIIVVETCTNLANSSWYPVQTNTLTSGTVYFNDSQWTNYPRRFYRLRSP